MADLEKVVDFRDTLDVLKNTIAPLYFSENVDQNRVSTFGYITEGLAHAWADSVILEQNRAEDYCPELSSNEVHVRQTAQLREVDINQASPYTAYAMIYIMKDDIIQKGEEQNDFSRIFRIPKQSQIISNGTAYSFEHDILVRAHMRPNGKYIYSAVYVDEGDENNSYIQMYEDNTENNEEVVAMILRVRQVEYNIQEKVVTDLLQFTYEGLSFDYNNYLAGFDVFYCLPNSSEYKKLEKEYYLTDSVSMSILYNDDDRNILYILMNPRLNIPVNSMIRVEIQETHGSDGSIAIDNSTTTFSLHKDNAYNYTGINIAAEIITTPEGGSNGDTLADIRHNLINAKMMRKNITTTLDIIRYINDNAANVQIIKKRNDIEDRMYYLYTLLRYNNDIVKTCTKKLKLFDEDFDYLEDGGRTMVMKVGHQFKLDPDTHLVTRIRPDENPDEIRFKLCLPFLVKVNESHILTYYCNALDTSCFLKTKETNPQFSYQLITNYIHMYRDPMDDENPDQYTFTLTGQLNTSSDAEVIDEQGIIEDPDKMRAYVVFKRENKASAYLLMKLDSYDKTDRKFTFIGKMRTNDFVTEENTMHITEGLKRANTTEEYNSVIDYKDATFDIHILYKDPVTASEITTTAEAFLYLPGLKDEYVLMNSYTNTSTSPYNLLIEMNKYSRSNLALEVRDLEAGTFNYNLDEVPFIEFAYAKENLVKLYPKFTTMHSTYTALIKNTTDFDVSLKFINTYGPSKYITVTGTTVETDVNGAVVRNEDGTLSMIDDEVYIRNLNPQLRFKVYGVNVVLEDIYQYIYTYIRDNYIIDTSMFISNICTAIERRFSAVRSIKYMGVDNYDASYQEFTYRKPDLSILQNLKDYIPEVFNTDDIVIEIDET